jgi:voltage-gated potassium channel
VLEGQNRIVDAAVTLAPDPGEPRSRQDQEALERFGSYMRVPIVLAALLPLFIIPEAGDPVAAAVGVVSWLIFLADFIVSERRRVHYLGTWLGRFDLAVVVLTAPWFLLPGARDGSFVVVLRLARLLRVVLVSRGAKRLFERVGRILIVAVAVVFIGSAVAYHAEHPTNPEFATFGDSLWWGIVTLTTVGYGDIVPKTAAGRAAGVMIMVTGVAVLGVLAGSLASFFRLDGSTSGDDPSVESEASDELLEAAPAAANDPVEVMAREVAQMREQMALLAERLGQNGSGSPVDPS